MSTRKQHATIAYFYWAFAVTAIGLVLAAVLGWMSTGTISGMMTIFFICAILSVLEISLSFDNAIVNANVLKTMDPVWQHRFLTWGIIIAVFGMRVIFPLLVVMIAAGLGPIEAVMLAATEPQEYARIMREAHLGIAAFGGTFLLMVALNYFVDHDKDVHWLHWLEVRLSSLGALRSIEVGFVLIVVLGFGLLLEPDDSHRFIIAAVYGLVTFLATDTLGKALDAQNSSTGTVAQGGLGAFLYLEVLDASFSFDGVVGAFALTQNLFIIAIGLGIGAMYVRSMTIMLVDRGTLAEFRYLEHGAFYAIFILALMMYTQTIVHVPEVITGLGGAAIIGVSLWSSIRWNRAHKLEASE